FGLSEEEPVVPALREPRVAAFQRVENRYAVHHHELPDNSWMIEGHPKHHKAAAIVAHRGEAVVAENTHQLDQRVGNGALRLLAVIGGDLRLARCAIPGHVGTDDAVAGP